MTESVGDPTPPRWQEISGSAEWSSEGREGDLERSEFRPVQRPTVGSLLRGRRLRLLVIILVAVLWLLAEIMNAGRRGELSESLSRFESDAPYSHGIHMPPTYAAKGLRKEVHSISPRPSWLAYTVVPEYTPPRPDNAPGGS